MKTALIAFLTVIFAISFNAGRAQSFTFSTDITSVVGSPGSFLNTRSYLVNNTNTSLTIRLKSIQFDVPVSWDLTYCGMWCGTSPLDSIDVIVPANNQLAVVIKGPTGQMGDSAAITIVAFDLAEPSVKDTCTYTYSTAKFGAPSSINELASGNVQIYPNPASDFVSIELNNGNNISAVEVYSLHGKLLISRKSLNNHIITISLEALPKGSYMLKYIDNAKTTRVNKILKIN